MLATPDRTVTLVAQERTAETAHRARLDHRALLVRLARTERKDHPETQPHQSQRPLANLDQPARTDHPAHLAATEPPVQTVLRVQQETRAHLDQPVHRATTVLLATRDRPAPTDPLENGVFARNIAPRMVVFSSRMEQGDKRSTETLSDEKPVLFMSITFVLVFACYGQFQTTSTAIASP